jgi:ankyrin repeat protein
MRRNRWGVSLFVAAMLAGAAPGLAQLSVSDGYSFLKAVRSRDGDAATKLADKPSTTVVNARDGNTGETALHITIKRRDMQWIQFVLYKGADVNIRDNQGYTPLADAASIGYAEGARMLLEMGAMPDLPDNRGETPLILATQAHDIDTVRLLVAAGADPHVPDNVAGLSAHDYAARDPRSAAILKVLDVAKPKPKKAVSGPTLN